MTQVHLVLNGRRRYELRKHLEFSREQNPFHHFPWRERRLIIAGMLSGTLLTNGDYLHNNAPDIPWFPILGRSTLTHTGNYKCRRTRSLYQLFFFSQQSALKEGTSFLSVSSARKQRIFVNKFRSSGPAEGRCAPEPAFQPVASSESKHSKSQFWSGWDGR